MKTLESKGAHHWDKNKSNSFKYIWRGLLSGEGGDVEATNVIYN